MANITVDIKKKSIEIGSNLVAIGKWWMNPWVYDPQEIKADAFDMDNMVDWIDKHYLTTEQIEEFDGKQDALTAWDNIDITNNVISATDTTYTAWEWISIDENNVISNTRVSAEWWNIEWDIEDQADLQEALADKQDVLTAGANVQIENNVISATDTTYTAWEWISIDSNNVISNTQTSAEWWNIEWDIEDQTDLKAALDSKQNTISDLSQIRSNATAGKNASDTIATYWDVVTHDVDEFVTSDAIGEWVLTIQKNSTTVDTFSANAKTDKTINITVPTQASDIGAMPDTTKYAANLEMSLNSSTYVITTQLKDQDGNNIWAARTIDLPLESVVVDWEYDEENKKIILTLENGNTIEFSVADLVSGLQTEITVDNKLDADLVDDTTASHKFVTSTEKSCISTAVQPWDLATYAKCCDIPTDNCQLANGCGYTTCIGTLVESDLQPYAKSCDLATVATSGKYCDLDWRVTDNCQIANSCGFTTCTWTLVASDIENLAQCCDIPTDNCQLANSCGYTTCTWTLVASDIENLAQCCDIPTDNCQLSNSCWYTTCTGTLVESDLCWYQKTCNMVCNLTDADNDHYPTAKAVADAMACAWVGDMLKSVYDPCWCEGDAFNACNMYNMPHIPTDNSELANGCWYIKWINCSDVTTALWYTPYNSTNPNWYTTCTWTLVQSDIANLAKCCDIPTDNCQLSNWCNYATCTYVNDSINSVTAYYITKDAAGNQFATYAELSAATTFYSGWEVRIPTRNDYTVVLADETHDDATTRYLYNNWWEYQYTINETALTQAQLDALNSWITCSKVSCYDSVVSTVSWFWDIVSCDASDFATPSDIPTDNYQLANGCGYTTCTWTLQSCDISCINWCVITNWWNVCIQWWIANDTTCTTSCIEAIWSWTKAQFESMTKDNDKYYIVEDAWSPVAVVTSVNWNTWAVTVSEFEPDNAWSADQVLTKTVSGYEWANAAWSDYSWVTKTITNWEIEIWLRTIVNVPTSNFTLTLPATLKDWEEYAIRIISETSYTMTLWTWFTNPRNVDTTLSGNATDQYVFLAINGELELQPLVDTWA